VFDRGRVDGERVTQHQGGNSLGGNAASKCPSDRVAQDHRTGGARPPAPVVLRHPIRHKEPSIETSITTTTRAREGVEPEDPGDEKSSSSLADELVQEYGLSEKQRQLVAAYCESLGEDYVRGKVEIVRAQPRRNAEGALLAALRDDWQPSVQSRAGAPDKQAPLEASRALARRMGWEWRRRRARPRRPIASNLRTAPPSGQACCSCCI
jgi:hypothetical protein